ncbi:MAG: hypothetical protein ACE15D_13230 [Candidatus Eisenbacteria bacterium]
MSRVHLKRLERRKIGGFGDEMKLSVPLPKTPKGMIHQRCPSESCRPRLFELGNGAPDRCIAHGNQHLVRRQIGTPGITCPYCGGDAPDDEYICEEDVRYARELIGWEAGRDMQDFMAEEARRFNQEGDFGLFKVRMEVKGNNRRRPVAWREDLLRDLTCDICGRRYGVFAIGLFCPDCGARNVHVHFAREIELVERQLALAQEKRQTDEELAYRLLANAHEDVLTAFETHLKTIYRFLCPRRLATDVAAEKCRNLRNRFQNEKKAENRFKDLSIDLFAALSEDERGKLSANIRKRHIVGHNLGIEDDEDVETRNAGTVVSLLVEDVRGFVAICKKVIISLEEQLPELLPPSNQEPEPPQEGESIGR